MPSNISTPEGLLEASNMMGNKLTELVAENEKLKVTEQRCRYAQGHTKWKQRVGTKEIHQCRTKRMHEKIKITLGLQIARLWSCSR